MKSNKTNDSKKVEINVEVTRAHAFDESHISFDAIVNGIQVNGLKYIEYVNKEGNEGTMISFPSYKDSKDPTKYWNHVWFPISKEVKANIIAQLEKLV